jgi:hypothetical protein
LKSNLRNGWKLNPKSVLEEIQTNRTKAGLLESMRAKKQRQLSVKNYKKTVQLP